LQVAKISLAEISQVLHLNPRETVLAFKLEFNEIALEHEKKLAKTNRP
jgi:hypothetical protein